MSRRNKRMTELERQLLARTPQKLGDQLTVRIRMKRTVAQEETEQAETASQAAHGCTCDHVTAAMSRLDVSGPKASAVLQPDNASDSDDPESLEFKITYNMKQSERRRREIGAYISPFQAPSTSIFLRVPPKPEDFARVERSRDRVEHLMNICNDWNSLVLTPSESKSYLRELDFLDVRCSALYPRTPAPGDKQKKSFRICPSFEPEIEDIERRVMELETCLYMIKCLYNLYGKNRGPQ